MKNLQHHNIKKLYFLLAVMPILLLFVSCDFLSEYPADKIPADEAIETVSDAETALNGVYAAARDYWSSSAIELADVMTDETFATNGYTRHAEMQAYVYSNNNSEIDRLWTNNYTVINRANRILKVIDNLSGATSKKNEIKGQALALRGIAYMELCKWFAAPFNVDSTGIGVPIKQTTNNNEKPQRAPLLDVYHYIESDLLQANVLLSDKTAVTNNTIRYVSSWACKAFLARFYLYKADYEKAVKYATEVINSNKFYLLTISSDMSAMWATDDGSELIFMLGYTNENKGGLIGANYYSRSLRTDPDTKKTYISAPMVNYVPSSQFLSVYDKYGPNNASKAAAADKRYGVYFTTETTINGWQSRICYKYPGNSNFSELNVNMPKIIRLPELYLIRAEAYAHILGKTSEALADYNYLRKSRISGYVNENSFTIDELKTEIFNERLRELCFEGFYWYDLKRSQKGFQRIPASTETNYIDKAADQLEIVAASYRWLLPVPTNEINGNPDIILNPGY